MNIIPKLSLNKHPKDDDNLSLVNALNIKVSNDESCITNEESIRKNVFIEQFLINYYGITEYNIISIIPCNNELVLIVTIDNKEAEIFRYREQTTTTSENMKLAYGDVNKLQYHGGKIKGTFTYNVEGSLIIAISEYDTNEKVPLKTINLGNFDNSKIYNDKDIPDGLLSISPEVTLPIVRNSEYIAGSAYKGWYYLFIRYKINSVDYTQWFNFGYPIYVDNIEQFQIVRYCYNRDTFISSAPPHTWGEIIFPNTPSDGYGAGCSDYFSNKQNIAKETFKINFYLSNNKYDKYQIGIVCASKSYIKAFKTSDINYVTNTIEYIFNSKTVKEASVQEFIIDNYNYFNAKNIINYKNRLYISNYLENNLNDNTITEDIINNINVKLYGKRIDDFGLVYDSAIFKPQNIANQYDTYDAPRIYINDYLKVSKDTRVTIKYGVSSVINTLTDLASNLFISTIYNDGTEAELGNIIIGHIIESGIEWIAKDNFNTTYILTLPDNPNAYPIELKRQTHAILSGRRYINTNKSFNERKLNSTLIPGEVYNFFIHFVDKYGHSTNGYRISNNKKCITEDDKVNEIVPVKFKLYIDDVYKQDIYAAFPVNNNVIDKNNKLNIKDIKFYADRKNNVLENPIIDNDSIIYCKHSFNIAFNSFENPKYKDFKWYQINTSYNELTFDLFINNNNDRLFRVPFNESFVDNDNIKKHFIYNVAFDNITIPKGYVGYFISYEKFESMQRATGILTRSDFRSQDYIENTNDDAFGLVYTDNTKKSDKMLFYSSVFDVSDNLKLDYNIIRIEGINQFKKDDIPEFDYMQRNSAYNFMHDMNKPQINSFAYDRSLAMPNYKIAVADSSIDNRMGVGTCLQIDDTYNLFPIYRTDNTTNDINLYRATLLNCSRNLYMSNNKTLIRLTDVIYGNKETKGITKGLNGHITYDGVIIYESAGINFNDADKKVKAFNENKEYYKSNVTKEMHHTYQNDLPFLAYVQFPIYSDIFFESKCYKNDPQGIVYFVKHDKEDATKNKFWGGSMVTPPNSIDLFENRQGSSDMFNPKTYTNYREDLVSVEEFDKTLRRSNVIQDESRINGWRTFPIEGYKNITENKGKITNLIGIGTMLLAHTEHSLFMFDTSNTLQTKNKDIQLAQPDAFDVDYKEVFTSDLGFGGLQDDKSYTIDQFGYIFYNNDFNRFYKFDAGQLVYIDDNIVQWLNKYKPYNIRFANDKNNTRLLINMSYDINNTINNVTLSYNYKAKAFISFHSYGFDEAYNTKSKLYFKYSNHNNCSLYNFINDNSSYCLFDNGIDNKASKHYPSKISIIINNDYESIKYLNYITYKLNKYDEEIGKDYTQLPVERKKIPFSGNTISVYNDLVNTGNLDITINTEEAKNAFAQYDKPFWELGNWNFNYLRNNIGGNVSADEMSRIFGNYFIVEFTFDNKDELKVDFETLNCNFSK